MADAPFCHTCGKASACSALMAYQSTGELPMTDTHCSCERGPTTVRFLESDVDIVICGATPAACAPQSPLSAEASPARLGEASATPAPSAKRRQKDAAQ